jgi:hypothetical protein
VIFPVANRVFSSFYCDVECRSNNKRNKFSVYIIVLEREVQRLFVPHFPLFLEEILHNWFHIDKEIRPLGRGAFGDALLCEHVPTKELLVVKRIPLLSEQPGFATNLFPNWLDEVRLLAKISSRHVLSLVDAFEEEHYGYIVVKYCENGSLRQLIAKHKKEHTNLSEQV